MKGATAFTETGHLVCRSAEVDRRLLVFHCDPHCQRDGLFMTLSTEIKGIDIACRLVDAVFDSSKLSSHQLLAPSDNVGRPLCESSIAVLIEDVFCLFRDRGRGHDLRFDVADGLFGDSRIRGDETPERLVSLSITDQRQRRD